MSRSVIILIALTVPFFLAFGSADAAMQYWEFQVDVISGPYSGNTYSGQFSFADDGLTGVMWESAWLNDLTFVFAGNTYTKADESDPLIRPKASFFNGVLGNIDYRVQKDPVPFEISAGMAKPAFIYGSGAFAGAGNVTYQQVPEPASLALLALGGFALLRRRTA